ncbi:MAG: hypothetical protein WC876_04465 [Candidatus Thermoplasmatota archaeon]|jgi:hypothetical protein
MKWGEGIVLWILTTVWICIEVAGYAAPSMPEFTPEQLDAATQLGLSIGFETIQLLAAALFLWIVKGVVGLVIMLLAGVEAVRWFRRHPPVAIEPDEGGAA